MEGSTENREREAARPAPDEGRAVGDVRVGEPSRTHFSTVFVATLAVAALVFLLYQTRLVVMMFLFSALLAIIVSRPVNVLAQRGISRALALGMVVVGFASSVWLVALILVPATKKQANEFIKTLPELLERAQERLSILSQWVLPRAVSPSGNASGADVLGLTDSNGEPVVSPLTLLSGLSGSDFSATLTSAAFGMGSEILAGAAFVLTMLMATSYMVVNPEPVLKGFTALFPAHSRDRVDFLLSTIYATLQRWMMAQLTCMLFVGATSTVILWLLGVPFALLLGIFAGITAFVPFFGAIIGAVPAVLVAAAVDPWKALWVVLAFALIQQVENGVFQPVLMSRAIKLHPVFVVFALLLMGTLFGVMGLLLAVPTLAVIQMLVRELWVSRMNRKLVPVSPVLPTETPPEPGLPSQEERKGQGAPEDAPPEESTAHGENTRNGAADSHVSTEPQENDRQDAPPTSR